MILAREALALLRDGNQRFVSNVSNRVTLADRARRIQLADGQEPFAAILGCSDSRVPVEIIFDQGLGDLFVIRGAGFESVRMVAIDADWSAVRFRRLNFIKPSRSR